MGPLLSCAISNLRQIHPVRLGPRQGPSQEAGTAVADARLIFSGQPRARHTPGLAPGSLVRPRSAGARPFTLFGPPRGDRPESALAATHGLAPAHSSQERRRGARGIRLGRDQGRGSPLIIAEAAGSPMGLAFSAGWDRAALRGGLAAAASGPGPGPAPPWPRPRPRPRPPPGPAAGSRGSTCADSGAGSRRCARLCCPGKSSRINKYGRGVSQGAALETTASLLVGEGLYAGGWRVREPPPLSFPSSKQGLAEPAVVFFLLKNAILSNHKK